jgi:hypothetical protein
MQSGKRLTSKDYFANILVHCTHKNHKNTNVELLIILSTVKLFLDNMVLANQNAKLIDRPRPGLSRVSPRPHTKALGTRLTLTLIFSA